MIILPRPGKGPGAAPTILAPSPASPLSEFNATGLRTCTAPSQNPQQPVSSLNPVPTWNSTLIPTYNSVSWNLVPIPPPEPFIQALPERMPYLFLVSPDVPQFLCQVLGSLGPLGSEPPGSLFHEDEGLLPTAHQLQQVGQVAPEHCLCWATCQLSESPVTPSPSFPRSPRMEAATYCRVGTCCNIRSGALLSLSGAHPSSSHLPPALCPPGELVSSDQGLGCLSMVPQSMMP